MQRKYEAMFLLKPDLTEEKRKTVYEQISSLITKNQGTVDSANVWEEKKKLIFPIKKCNEALYYLVEFNSPASAISKLRAGYKLNESIIRLLILNLN